ncbi:MAG: hypothetical protein BGN88_13600 [Clostridiales bacterium 43-6]|nr:MAG: hypothetical protein BGN88_13600 [Clostridiales bacterium 43-6]
MKKIMMTIVIFAVMLSGCNSPLTKSDPVNTKYYVLEYYGSMDGDGVLNNTIVLTDRFTKADENDYYFYTNWNKQVYQYNDLIFVSDRKSGKYALYRFGKGIVSDWYDTMIKNESEYIIAQSKDNIVVFNENGLKKYGFKYGGVINEYAICITIGSDDKILITENEGESYSIYDAKNNTKKKITGKYIYGGKDYYSKSAGETTSWIYNYSGQKLFDFAVSDYYCGNAYESYVRNSVYTLIINGKKKDYYLEQGESMSYLGNGILKRSEYKDDIQYVRYHDADNVVILNSAEEPYNGNFTDDDEESDDFLYRFDDGTMYIYNIRTRKEIIIYSILEGQIHYENGFYVISGEGGTKILDRNFAVVGSVECVDVKAYPDRFIAYQNGVSHLMGSKLEEMNQIQGHAEYLSDGLYRVTSGNYMGIVNEKGTWRYKTLMPAMGDD